MRLEAPYYSTTALLFFRRPSLSKGKEELCENLRTGASFWSILVFSVSRPSEKKESRKNKRRPRPMINFFANSKPFFLIDFQNKPNQTRRTINKIHSSLTCKDFSHYDITLT